MSADPLNCDLTSLDTSRKILAPDRMNLQIKKAEIKSTAANDGRFISLELVTLDAKPDIAGATISPGHMIFDQVMVNPTGAATWDMVLERMARLVQATRLNPPIDPKTPDLWLKQLEGKTVIAQIDYEPEGVGKNGKRYDAKNVVGKYLKQ